MIQTNSLEIFKQNTYIPNDIGLVSNNAYLSIVVTNNCQRACVYCINSETNHSLELPIDKAVENIRLLVTKYKIKEAILLGGEPTLHSDLFRLLKELRTKSGLELIRLTTNAIKLKDNSEFIERLVHPQYGIQGLNISFHNEDFVTYRELRDICVNIKKFNSDIKIRINTNIWRNNNDKFTDLTLLLDTLEQYVFFVDEVRVSNLIPKDSFSVNPVNSRDYVGLSVEEYNEFFEKICEFYSSKLTLIENKETLGFVRYVLIPTKLPIILNWNTSSTVSEQICENNPGTKHINTFKCLVDGDISLSWNTNNVIKLLEDNY